MDYSRHYYALIDRARCRVIEGYSERHHIVPRCIGGDDSECNLVRLMPEERCWTEEQKAQRRAYRHTEEARQKIAATSMGRKHSLASIAKMRGKKSPETRERMKLAAIKRAAAQREKREAVNAN